MQVSAVNMQNNGYVMSNNTGVFNARLNDIKGDTSFNSLTPYSTKRATTQEPVPMVFDSVNQWKKFCHQRILGGKLNIIA